MIAADENTLRPSRESWKSGAEMLMLLSPPSVYRARNATSPCGLWSPLGFSSTAFITLNTATFAPIPKASVRIAVVVKAGDLRNWRKAYRSSCRSLSTSAPQVLHCVRQRDSKYSLRARLWPTTDAWMFRYRSNLRASSGSEHCSPSMSNVHLRTVDRDEIRERPGVDLLSAGLFIGTAMPVPSLKLLIASAFASKVSTNPLGQRISSESIFAAEPSPKCTRISLDEL